jgi:hypothetical protein
MNATDLKRFGLVQVAHFHIAGRNFIIDPPYQERVKIDKCIYAFLIDGKVVRIGSSKAPLKDRLRDYELHISHALKGEKSPTPKKEAKKWRELLPAGISGDIYARRGTKVKTPILKKPFPAYLDEESILIGMLFDEPQHDHILNRNKHR